MEQPGEIDRTETDTIAGHVYSSWQFNVCANGDQLKVTGPDQTIFARRENAAGRKLMYLIIKIEEVAAN